MTDVEAPAIASLIEPDRVHRTIYTDLAIFEAEMTRIFERTWIYIGHESQIPAAGDYYATTIGRQPVVMVRQRDGAITVLHNRCAHKGALLVPSGAGNVKAFRCAYHGWCYHLDGQIMTIPRESGYADSGFGKHCREANMPPVARYGVYRGFVFASLAAEGPGLEDWLVGVGGSIDNMIDRSPEGALEIVAPPLRYRMRVNWKFHVENLNDLLHPMVAHQSATEAGRRTAGRHIEPGEKAPMAIEILAPFSNSYDFFEEMGLHAFPYGHSYSGGRTSIHAAYSDIPGYNEALERSYGDARAREILSTNRHNTVVYPSLTLKGAIQTIRVVKPIAVDCTEIESWTFRLKGAPDELLKRSVLYSNLINSSAGLVQPDDHEAYRRLQHGLLSEGLDWVSMHRHLGEEEQDGEGGRSATGSSDMVFRNQYREWQRLMTEDAA